MGVSSLATASDYSLTNKFSSFSEYQFSHKSNGQMTLEGNFKVHNKDNLLLTVHSNHTLNQSQNNRELSGKLFIRAHHLDNKIFAFGLEDFDVLSGRNPDVFSTSLIFGRDLNKEYRGVIGAYTAFRLSTKSLVFARYLLGIKNKTFSAHVELGKTRKTDKDATDEKLENHINVLVDGKINDNLKIASDIKCGSVCSAYAFRLAGNYKVSKDTSCKFKVQNDNSLGFSVTHNYRNLLTFTFASKLAFKAPQSKEDVRQFGYCKTKFGAAIEINDTL